MNGPDRRLHRTALHAALLALPVPPAVAGDPNRSLFASLIAGQASGFGCLPPDLGLGAERRAALLKQYFPGATLPRFPRQLPAIPEWEDLRKLLLQHRAGRDDHEVWLAEILASACAGADHLWQDLGLAQRDELSQLIRHNFPGLAAANSGDMKWKKFLYRQFCAQEGIYVCPAPSCAVCKDHALCFGSET
jgi:nitrogen fixation protein NifQ